MRYQRRFLLLLCLFFLFASSVGVGVAYFVLDGGTSSEGDQTVTVSPAPSVELGELSLIDPAESYQIFFDVDAVTLIGSDNLSREAEFALSCDFSKVSVAVPTGYRLALACDVTVSDTERGVKLGRLSTAYGEDFYFYSSSVADYLLPIGASVGTEAQERRFSPVGSVATSQSETYRCILFDDISCSQGETALTTDSFRLRFGYKSFDMTDGGNHYTGSMMPDSQYTTVEGYKAVMGAIREAEKNAEIKIVFRLVLEPSAG